MVIIFNAERTQRYSLYTTNNSPMAEMELLNKALKVLPATEEDIVIKGIILMPILHTTIYWTVERQDMS
jgi:hypothetical protein